MSQWVKMPQVLNVNIKEARGAALAFASPLESQIATKLTWLFPQATSDSVSLKPGESVTATVTLTDVPGDANFLTLTAGLIVENADLASEPMNERTTVKKGSTSTTYDVAVTAPRKVPTNLEVKLKDGDVLWSFASPISDNDTFSFPDIAQAGNDYLDRQTRSGEVKLPIKLPFEIKSDRAAQVKIGIYELRYSRLKTQVWLNDLDQTTRVDRNLKLGFAEVQEIPLDALPPGNPITLYEVRLDIGGQFSAERLLGSVISHDGRDFATVSSNYGVAQSLRAPLKIRCSGVSVLLRFDVETEIYTEIQPDQNGMPASGTPLAQANVTLTPPAADAPIGWTFIPFDQPLDLQADSLCWVVIKGVRGIARLALAQQTDTYLLAARVTRGGQLWKPISREMPPMALIRLVYLPELDHQTAAITIGVKAASALFPIDPAPNARSISLPVTTAPAQAVLIVESHGQGDLSIANVVQEFRKNR